VKLVPQFLRENIVPGKSMQACMGKFRKIQVPSNRD